MAFHTQSHTLEKLAHHAERLRISKNELAVRLFRANVYEPLLFLTGREARPILHKVHLAPGLKGHVQAAAAKRGLSSAFWCHLALEAGLGQLDQAEADFEQV